MSRQDKNKKLIDNNVYYPSMEHEACGVGMIASTDGKKTKSCGIWN